MEANIFIVTILFSLCTCDYQHPDIGKDSRHTKDDKTRMKRDTDSVVEDKKYWMEQGAKELQEALKLEKNNGLAKNIILLIGDGMSMNTVSAARILKGQQENKDGPSSSLSWEKFPNFGMAKTYNIDSMVPDSAATAFAIMSGVKTNFFTVGYDNSVVRGDALASHNATRVATVLQWAQNANMRTGLVTTTRITHATPAAAYAATANRDWECDTKLPKKKPDSLKDIARQLVEDSPGRDVDIVLGGGREAFTTEEAMQGANYNQSFKCLRKDEKDLIQLWKENNPKGDYVETVQDLKNLDLQKVEKLLGLFSMDHIPYSDELAVHSDAPRLADMVETAINFLQTDNKKGYFLLIEGGRIDHSHHDGAAVRALTETLEMDSALETALSKVDLQETLVIVTADHSHTMTLGGYPGRTADVTGIVHSESTGWTMKGLDGHTFPMLGYANGPGFLRLQVKENSEKTNWEAIERTNVLSHGESAPPTFLQPSAVPLDAETHGGDDVGIWATGPMSHLFHKTHEQSYIGHVMSHAGCIGPHADAVRCQRLRR